VPQSPNCTALYDTHLSMNGKMVPFAGWEMPLQFQGILAETSAVRSHSGLFDVSHMGRIWATGPQAAALLDWLVTANVPALGRGRARYTLFCTENGGILDDCIVYNLDEDKYLLVCNAANRNAVWQALLQWRDSRFNKVDLDDRTLQVGMIAFQGPRAIAALDQLAPGLADRLRPFRCVEASVAGITALVARTGYTGEDGVEIMPNAEHSVALWQRLMETGAAPCGLGARDVLRLEAGLLLHGNDMDVSVNPFEAGLDRFVFTDKESICSDALRRVQLEGVRSKLTGFRMLERGIPRHGYALLHDGDTIGRVTSGGYAPTLDSYIGLGYVSVEMADSGSRFHVDMRGKLVGAEVMPLPFYSRRRN
jgi:aminomethyltransferase